MQFYLLSPDARRTAIACAPDNVPSAYLVEQQLIDAQKLPFELVLQDISFPKSGAARSSNLSDIKLLWPDYQANSLAWPIFSERLRLLTDSLTVGQDLFEWIEVVVRQNAKTMRLYYIPRFKYQPDVLDIAHTIFGGRAKDFIVKPAFAKAKIHELSVFCLSDSLSSITSGLYVSHFFKQAVTKQKLVGLDFEPLGLSSIY